MATPPPTPTPIEIVYRHVDGIDLWMDVYIPESASTAKPAPVLLWWHGGGLIQGTRKAVAPHHLAAPRTHDLCLISADYRLAPQTRIPDILSDCKSAIEYIKSPAFSTTNGRIDTSKIIVSGSSAGGWLSLLAGTGIGYKACGIEPPPAVSGIAAIYPITDLLDPFWSTPQHPVSYMDRIIDRSEVEPFLDPYGEKVGFSASDSKRSIFYTYMVQESILEDLLLRGTNIPASAFSVAATLKSGGFTVPPTYIVHGTVDDKVPIKQSTDVVDVLREKRFSVDYEELDGLNHLFDREPQYQMERMYAFIEGVVKAE